jgi:hypothetical protein
LCYIERTFPHLMSFQWQPHLCKVFFLEFNVFTRKSDDPFNNATLLNCRGDRDHPRCGSFLRALVVHQH